MTMQNDEQPIAHRTIQAALTSSGYDVEYRAPCYDDDGRYLGTVFQARDPRTQACGGIFLPANRDHDETSGWIAATDCVNAITADLLSRPLPANVRIIE